jgi:hypothetical protein
MVFLPAGVSAVLGFEFFFVDRATCWARRAEAARTGQVILLVILKFSLPPRPASVAWADRAMPPDILKRVFT